MNFIGGKPPLKEVNLQGVPRVGDFVIRKMDRRVRSNERLGRLRNRDMGASCCHHQFKREVKSGAAWRTVLVGSQRIERPPQGGLKMKKFFAVSFLAIAFSATAAENSQSHEVGKVDDAKSAKELADMVVSWSSGYCKVQAEKQGADFNTCFTRVTNMAIEKLQNAQAMQ